MKRHLFAALAALVGANTADAAEVLFNANGILSDGGSLSGSLVIDTDLGRVTTADLMVSGSHSLTFTEPTGFPNGYYAGLGASFVYIIDGPSVTPTTNGNYFVLLIDGDLTGYGGGLLFGTDNPTIDGYNSGYILDGPLDEPAVGIDLVRGALSIAPEPASWMMLAGGFGAIGYAMRRRRVAFA